MSDPMVGTMRIESENDIVSARRAVREAAVALGFGVTDVTRIVTAASELTRNIYLYAGQGEMSWSNIRGSEPGLELIFNDKGPGIADVKLAMEPGYTSGKGLGMGLPGAKRLMDMMEIDSTLGKGTKVRIVKWCRN